MGLFKSFAISLVVYFLLSFVLGIVLYMFGFGTDIATYFQSNPLSAILNLIFSSGFLSPGYMVAIFAGADLQNNLNQTLLFMVWILVPGVIAGIVAGRTTISDKQGFMAMILVMLVNASGAIVLALSGEVTLGTFFFAIITPSYGSMDNTILIIVLLLQGLFCGIFYGGIAALFGKND